MAKKSEQKFDRQKYDEDVRAAREEAEDVGYEPISPDITESEWNMRKERLGQEDAKWLFAVVDEHGEPNIIPDLEPEEEELTAEEPKAKEKAPAK
jgi:hypothetical protein